MKIVIFVYKLLLWSSKSYILPYSSEFLCTDFEDDGEDESDGGWQQELQRRYAQEANFMAELRARHPASPPENNQSSGQSYPPSSFGQNFNHGGQNFHIQGIHYPQNHGMNSGPGYANQQQNYPSYTQASNQTPFGHQVGGLNV